MKLSKGWMPLLSFLLFCTLTMSVFAAGSGAESDTASVSIPVSCTGKNTTETFTFWLKAESTDNQIIQNDSLSLKDGEEGKFVIRYTEPGTYHYTISQDKGTDAKTTYDDTVYAVDVYVMNDEQGVMTAEPVVYIKGSSGKKDKVSFVNQKKEAPPEKEDPSSDSQKKPESNGPVSSIQTGDSNLSYLYAGLCAISGFLLLAMVMLKKRKAKLLK